MVETYSNTISEARLRNSDYRNGGVPELPIEVLQAKSKELQLAINEEINLYRDGWGAIHANESRKHKGYYYTFFVVLAIRVFAPNIYDFLTQKTDVFLRLHTWTQLGVAVFALMVASDMLLWRRQRKLLYKKIFPYLYNLLQLTSDRRRSLDDEKKQIDKMIPETQTPDQGSN